MLVGWGRAAFYRLARAAYALMGAVDIDRKRRPRPTPFDHPLRQSVRWPNGAKAAFVLQWDDACPKDGLSDPYDYGGNPQGFLPFLDTFWEQYPQVKMTVFMIADAQFKNKGYYREAYPSQTWAVDRHPVFCQWFLDRSSRLEVANHGLTHYQDERWWFLKAREFEFKTEGQSRAAIAAAQARFHRAGFRPRGFKPSGWGIGHNARFGLLLALPELQFDYVCLCSPQSGLNWDADRYSSLYPTFIGPLLNIPQNLGLVGGGTPLADVDRIVEARGLISLQGHFNTQLNWMADGVGPRSLAQVAQVVDHLESRYPGQIWYATLADVAGFWRQEYGA